MNSEAQAGWIEAQSGQPEQRREEEEVDVTTVEKGEKVADPRKGHYYYKWENGDQTSTEPNT
jgi:hypothetical protein